MQPKQNEVVSEGLQHVAASAEHRIANVPDIVRNADVVSGEVQTELKAIINPVSGRLLERMKNEAGEAAEVVASANIALTLNAPWLGANRAKLAAAVAEREVLVQRIIHSKVIDTPSDIPPAPIVTPTQGGMTYSSVSKATMNDAFVGEQHAQEYIGAQYVREMAVQNRIALFETALAPKRFSPVRGELLAATKKISGMLGTHLITRKAETTAKFDTLTKYAQAQDGGPIVAGSTELRTKVRGDEIGAVVAKLNSTLLPVWRRVEKSVNIGGRQNRPDYVFSASAGGGITVEMPGKARFRIGVKNIPAALEIIEALEEMYKSRAPVNHEEVFTMLNSAA